MQEICQESKF